MFIDFYYGVTVFSGRNSRLNHLRLSFTQSQPSPYAKIPMCGNTPNKNPGENLMPTRSRPS